MTNIVVHGRGTLFTTQSANEVAASINRNLGQTQMVDGGADIVTPRGWVRLVPSGTLVNVLHIVSISDTE
jgi:hypothetical protein